MLSGLAGIWECRAPGAAWPVGAQTPQGTPLPANVLPWLLDEALQPCGRQPRCLSKGRGAGGQTRWKQLPLGKWRVGAGPGRLLGGGDAGGEPSLPS